jgi:predicted lysophospholipase L1 biosynthesis ABC-type transport system permease subunit
MRSYPPFMSSLRIQAVVHSLHEQTVEQARRLVRTLFLATMVVLLIACANLAGLLLVRGIRRRRQIALQMALGAPASTLLREAVLESLLLSITGGVFGVGLAAIALRVGVSLLPETLPRIQEIRLDGQVVLFAIVLSVLTGIVCGLAPAFAACGRASTRPLRKGGARARWAEGKCGFAPRWWLMKSPSRWCCWRLPDCCCGALRRCLPSISASARTSFGGTRQCVSTGPAEGITTLTACA